MTETVHDLLVEHGAPPMKFMTRAPRPDDQSYIARTWVSSVLDGARMWQDRGEIRQLNATVDKLLDDPLTRIIVACNPEKEDRIYGWLAYSKTSVRLILLYLNVRAEHRHRGIARAMWREVTSDRADNDWYPERSLCYLFDGPSAPWLRKRQPATKLEWKDYLR